VPAGELKVDVILPTHAGERWVDEAIESVLGQTYAAWHLTVVDDCSPDATPERVAALRRRHADRITLIRLDRPRRAAGARMLGVSRTSGDLIAFLDQDDRWLPEKLARQVACFAGDPALAAVHTDVEIIDPNGVLEVGAAERENAIRAGIVWGSGAELAAVLFRKNAIRLASSAVRRSAFEAIGGFDTSLFGGEDWEFWVRMADGFSIAHLPMVLTQRRIHPSNVSRVRALERARGKLEALRKMQQRYPCIAPHVADKRRQLLGQAAISAARQRHPFWASFYACALVAQRLRESFATPLHAAGEPVADTFPEAEREKRR
jgi:glycosyltransferase involved in cell wall biosynthesis